MPTMSQKSLAAGEIAPALYPRTDTTKFASGLRTLRNMTVMRHGGAQSKAGQLFVGEVKDSSKTVRMLPFIFNSTQTYILEFGDLYMRVIRRGAYVTETAQNITAITNANPCVLTYSGADNYAVGDEIYISGIVGAIGTYLNNRNFKVAVVNTGTNAITLDYMDGTDVNSTSFGAYTSGGTIAEVYTITTPYLEADLSTLQFVQSADVVTIVHPSYAPRELSRTGHASWTLALCVFEPAIDGPVGGAVTSVAAGANTYRWRITSIADETFEESLPGYEASQAITGITQANPAVVTYTGADSFQNGDEVFITGVLGMTEVNDLTFTVAGLNAGANTFQLSGINSTAYTAYSSAGTVAKTYIRADSAAVATSTDPHILSWTAVSGAQEYNVYEELNGVYGFIGVAGGTTFNVVGALPDTTNTPPTARNPFGAADDYPSTVTYFQQRIMYANTNNDPEKVFGSKTGQFKNFTVSSPVQDDDAVTFTMAGRQVNEVLHLIELGKLLVLTTGSEISVGGDTAGILRPGQINPKQESYNGSATLSPILVGGNALYVQARGSVIRDFNFDLVADGYKGNDLTIFSSHLIDGYTLVDWTYQQIPHSIVWAVRDDGVLIGMTYVKEQQIIGWHRHDFDGTVENVCCVPEGGEDVLYLVIKRTINGRTVRYVEQMQSRLISDIVDYVGMESALSYDGRNATARTMTLSGSGWTYTDTLTLTASSAFFTSDDVGNAIYMNIVDSAGETTDTVRCTIMTYSSVTVVSVLPHKTVPVALRAAATLEWARAVDSLTGLWHLEGKAVSILGDGFVVASPNNAANNIVTITNGTATLDRPYSVIHVGLPFTCDIETLDIDMATGETLADKRKNVSKLTIHVEKSRGIWAGSQPPTDDDDDPLEGLAELKIRDEASGYDSPVGLQTGTVEILIEPQWNANGRVFIRQVDPLPLSVLAIAPAGMVPIK